MIFLQMITLFIHDNFLLMKTLYATILSFLFSFSAFAQKDLVEAAFTKYGLDVAILNPDLKQRPTQYSFDLKYTTITNESEKVVVAKFDPSKSEDDRWTVQSINGGKPLALDIKAFKKAHAEQPVSSAKIDESTLKVEQETADHLIVSYKVDPNTLSKDASFLKDCRNHAKINLKTKHLEELQTLNEKPVKIKILNAQKLDLVIKYTYHEDLKKYLPDSETLVVVVKLLGQETTMTTISEYSNYTK